MGRHTDICPELEDLGGGEPLLQSVAGPNLLENDRVMLRRISAALATLAKREDNIERNTRLNLMAGWLLGFATRYPR